MQCTRKAGCKCEECVVAFSMFTASDLTAIASSSVNFDEEVEENKSSKVSQDFLSPKTKKKEPPQENNNMVSESSGKEDSVPLSGAQNKDEGEFENLSYEDLLSHSVWKARRHGYEKLLSSLGEAKVEEIRSVLSLNALAKISAEKSAAAYDPALKLVAAYCLDEKSIFRKFSTFLKDEENSKQLSSFVQGIVQKGFTGRTSTTNLAFEVFTNLASLHPDLFQFLLMEFKEMQVHPKCRALKAQENIIICSSQICSTLGVLTSSLTVLKDILVHGLSSKLVKVRTSSFNFSKNVQSFLGAQPTFLHLLSAELKNQTLKKEVSLALEKVQEETKQTGCKEAKKAFLLISKEEDNRDPGATLTAVSDDCLYDSLPEKAVIAKIYKQLDFEKKIKAAKWSERKSVLEEAKVLLLGGTDAPLIKLKRDDEYMPLFSLLKGIIVRDANMNVLVSAIGLVTLFIHGLRSGFKRYWLMFSELIFEKLKEKSKPMIMATTKILQVFRKYLFDLADSKFWKPLASILSTRGKNITALQKTRVLDFFLLSVLDQEYYLQDLAISETSEAIETLLNGLEKCLEDADQKNRKLAAKNLEKWLKLASDAGAQYQVRMIIEVQTKNPKTFKGIKSIGASKKRNSVSNVRSGSQPRSPIKKASNAPIPPSTIKRPKKNPRKRVSNVGHSSKVENTLNRRSLEPSSEEKLSLKEIIEKMSNDETQMSWRTRLAALETLVTLLMEQPKTFHSYNQAVTSLTRVLCNRLHESNKQLVLKGLIALQKIFQLLQVSDKFFFFRDIERPMLKLLQDSRKAVQSQLYQLLTSLVTFNSSVECELTVETSKLILEKLIFYVGVYDVTLREHYLHFLNEIIQRHHHFLQDIVVNHEVFLGIRTALCSKNNGTRRQGAELLGNLSLCIGQPSVIESMNIILRDEKPMIRSSMEASMKSIFGDFRNTGQRKTRLSSPRLSSSSLKVPVELEAGTPEPTTPPFKKHSIQSPEFESLDIDYPKTPVPYSSLKELPEQNAVKYDLDTLKNKLEELRIAYSKLGLEINVTPSQDKQGKSLKERFMNIKEQYSRSKLDSLFHESSLN
eukprot:snap_masked-scaffold_32-processed-gene-3.11-mRNA-1 protein AED:1.00 eAED:1.00 QI:0/-1/0/0/-1/1/1/0/1075